MTPSVAIKTRNHQAGSRLDSMSGSLRHSVDLKNKCECHYLLRARNTITSAVIGGDVDENM